jgi:hypothetical protein
MLGQSFRSPKELQRMLIAGKTFFPLLAKYIYKYLFSQKKVHDTAPHK